MNIKIKTLAFFALIALVLLSVTSCKTTSKNVIYADYIAFGDNAKANYKIDSHRSKGKPYTIYDKEKKINETSMLQGELRSIKQENNTAGIYAMDKALDRIRYVQKKIFKKDPNTKYYVIFMTDGLDNVSVQVARNNGKGSYKTTDVYKNNVKNRIVYISRYKKKEKNDFNIYPIVFVGEDLGEMKSQNNMQDEEFEDFIDENMGWLKGSSKGPENAPDIIKNSDFDVITKEFKNVFRTANFEFAVPKGYVNRKIKMELRGTGEDTTTIHDTYFTAVLKNKGSEYYMTDIKFYDGLFSDSGKDMESKKFKLYATNNRDKKGTLSTFVIDKPMIKIEEKNDPESYFILQKEVVQLTAEYDPKNPNKKDVWLKNSEYDSQLKSMANAYIQIIIDCSLSLGEQFEKEVDAAGNIITFIREMAIGTEERLENNN